MDESVNREPLIPDVRLRELTDRGWLLKFLEAYPEVRRLRRGAENGALDGAIDVHVHADPCSLIGRNQDFVEVALDAARAGLRGIIRKNHHYSTVGKAYTVQRHVDYLVETGVLPRTIGVWGGVPITFSVDPRQVEVALRFPSLKMIWLNPVHGETLVDELLLSVPPKSLSVRWTL